MRDRSTSTVDGVFLLPFERMTPSNIGLFKGYIPKIEAVNAYMALVETASYNYEKGFTEKIVLNPADIQLYIANIRAITLRIGGGYDEDGVQQVDPLAAHILPDLLITLREQQVTLCQLYALSIESQGELVGPIDKIAIETLEAGGEQV